MDSKINTTFQTKTVEVTEKTSTLTVTLTEKEAIIIAGVLGPFNPEKALAAAKNWANNRVHKSKALNEIRSAHNAWFDVPNTTYDLYQACERFVLEGE